MLGRWSGGRCSEARLWKLESSRPKPGRMEETPKGGRGPPWAVALLEREVLQYGSNGSETWPFALKDAIEVGIFRRVLS